MKKLLFFAIAILNIDLFGAQQNYAAVPGQLPHNFNLLNGAVPVHMVNQQQQQPPGIYFVGVPNTNSAPKEPDSITDQRILWLQEQQASSTQKIADLETIIKKYETETATLKNQLEKEKHGWIRTLHNAKWAVSGFTCGFAFLVAFVTYGKEYKITK